MQIKNALSRFRCSAYTPFRFVFVLSGLFVHIDILFNQDVIPYNLNYFTISTGLTTGTIANLYITNYDLFGIQTTIGDCFIASEKGYQGYVIPSIYPLFVPPLTTIKIKLNGFCTDVYKPAIPEGEPFPSVSKWISWASADEIPLPGSIIPPKFTKILDSFPNITYPGSLTPFPFKTNIHENPAIVTRLLLHWTYAASKSIDYWLEKNKLKLSSEEKENIIQQLLWSYSARLEGKLYNKNSFLQQFIEELEQTQNQLVLNMPSEKVQKITSEATDVWAQISIIGEGAKIIPVNENHRNDLFKIVPVGSSIDPFPKILKALENDTLTEEEFELQLKPVLFFLKDREDTSIYKKARETILLKWIHFQDQKIQRINFKSTASLPLILQLLSENKSFDLDSNKLINQQNLKLSSLLNQFVKYQISNLNNSDSLFIFKWRTVDSWRYCQWYKEHCSDIDLKNLQRFITPSNLIYNENKIQSNVSLTGALWKHPVSNEPIIEKDKHPWWIAATGVPVLGIATYLLVKTSNESRDSIPVNPSDLKALTDTIRLSCGLQTIFNVVSNDKGEDIKLISVSTTTGINITAFDFQHVLVKSNGPGSFITSYIISDKFGKTATGNIILIVNDLSVPLITCPKNISVDCFAETKPLLTGSAIASDDCPDIPAINYTDQISDSACQKIITRQWIATDASNNSSQCFQRIAVIDTIPPVFSLCPPSITVNCGKQNNFNVTGMAKVMDSCTDNLTLTHTDDLSLFKACQGKITRTFIVTDLCGNSNRCKQSITITNTPCGFNPNFNITNALCERCIGVVKSNMTPPGNYSFEWEDGSTDKDLLDVCPGTHTVTITDENKECANVLSFIISNINNLSLTVTQITRPSGPRTLDGTISLRIDPINAAPPFQVFVNGIATTSVNNFNFQLTQLMAGEYLIYVVDQAGQGCLSNEVIVQLIPRLQAFEIIHPGVEISNDLFSTINNAIKIPETWSQILKSNYSESSEFKVRFPLEPSYGSVIKIPINHSIELRSEAIINKNYAWIYSNNLLIRSVRYYKIGLGIRKYLPLKNVNFNLFNDIQLAKIHLNANSYFVNQSNRSKIANMITINYQLKIEGGLKYQILPRLNFETVTGINCLLGEEKVKFQPFVNGRIIILFKFPFKLNNKTRSYTNL